MSDKNVKEEAPEQKAPEVKVEEKTETPVSKEEVEETTEETPEEEVSEEVETPAKEEAAIPVIPTAETNAPEPFNSMGDKETPPIPNIATSTADGKHDPFANDTVTVSAPVLNRGVEVARQALPTIKGVQEIIEEEDEPEVEEKSDEPEAVQNTHIYALRTTANREDQVMGFVASNAGRKKLGVYSVIAPHGMRGYIFVEAADRHEAEQAAFGVPYAKGLLPNEIEYKEIEHMLEQVKKEINIQKNDIAEILSGPFKREKAKIARVDKAKEEVVVELLEAAVPIPITLKIDAVKVIRRDEK